MDSKDLCELSRLAMVVFHDDESPDETKANARLMAAAPELLDTLKHCTEVLRAWCVTKDEEQVINNADALIAKAEGRE